MENSRDRESLEERKQKLYSYAQICLFELMRLEHTVEDEDDYCSRIAPIIEMVRFGVLSCSECDPADMRAQMKKFTK